MKFLNFWVWIQWFFPHRIWSRDTAISTSAPSSWDCIHAKMKADSVSSWEDFLSFIKVEGRHTNQRQALELNLPRFRMILRREIYYICRQDNELIKIKNIHSLQAVGFHAQAEKLKLSIESKIFVKHM